MVLSTLRRRRAYTPLAASTTVISLRVCAYLVQMAPPARSAPAATLLLLLAAADAARLPLSPFPVPAAGLNATRQLFVFEQTGLSPSQQLLAATLQGVLSRSSPAIYRATRPLNATGNSYAMWLRETAARFSVALDATYVADLPGLLKHFAPQLDGYVLCNVSDASVNAAVAASAARRIVAITPETAGVAAAAGLSQLYDARGKDTAWALATFNGTAGFAYSPRVTVLQDPSKADAFMSDYAVAAGALQWWDADVNSALARRVWGSMHASFAALGWGPDEKNTVSAVTAAGGVMVASDWAQNVDVLSAFDTPAFKQRAAPPLPPQPLQQHTVSFLMSDGDNIQFVLVSATTRRGGGGSF